MTEQPTKETKEKSSVVGVVIVTIIVTLIAVGIVSAISNTNSQNPNQSNAVASSTQNQTGQQSAPAPVTPTANEQATPSVSPTLQPSYYAPMTFSPAVEAQRSSFVNGCESAGTTANTWGKCNCNFDYIISNYGLVWLINEEAYINVNGVASPEYRSEALAAYKYCSVFDN